MVSNMLHVQMVQISRTAPDDYSQIPNQSGCLPLLELSALPEISFHLPVHVLAELRVRLIAEQLVQYLCTQRTGRG